MNEGDDTSARVDDWENALAKGGALASQMVWERYVNSVEDLRARQKKYESSLPRDPIEATKRALMFLRSDGGLESEYPDGFEDALYESHALSALLVGFVSESNNWELKAARHLAQRISASLRITMNRLDHIRDTMSAALLEK